MKLPSLFKSRETRQTPWQWPSCNKHPNTFSFRIHDDIFKTVNSVFFDPDDHGVQTPDSWFTNSAESPSFSNSTAESDQLEPEQQEEEVYGGGGDEESLEMVIRGARSEERLFFESAGGGGGGDTSSILKKEKNDPFKESVVLAMESEDPYLDFKKSMEEMVEVHGLMKKEWRCLEELLGWYLRMNGKKNHGVIVDAFVDLLLATLTATPYSTSSADSSSSSSSLTRSPLCSSEDDIEIDDKEEKMV